MRIIENPNPVPTHILTCEKCSCKFEFTDSEIEHHNWSDANGRIGGTHHWSSLTYINCPNCGEKIIISRKSGYGSSMIDDYHVTEEYHIKEDDEETKQQNYRLAQEPQTRKCNCMIDENHTSDCITVDTDILEDMKKLGYNIKNN